MPLMKASEMPSRPTGSLTGPARASPASRITGLIWDFSVGAEGIEPPTLRQPPDTFPAQILLSRAQIPGSYGSIAPSQRNGETTSYTTITVSRPGAAFSAASNADEANAVFAQVQAIIAANGGEMGMIGFDHAQNANVAFTTYPDPESAAKAAIQIEANQLLDVVSRGMFSTMEELWPVFMDALG